MVVLVRCSNDTCSLALKSHLNDLIDDGLVTAFLSNGEWITAEKSVPRGECTLSKQSKGILASFAAPF